MNTSYPIFSYVWEGMTKKEQKVVRTKAKWEGEGLWSTLCKWPDLVPERFKEVWKNGNQ